MGKRNSLRFMSAFFALFFLMVSVSFAAVPTTPHAPKNIHAKKGMVSSAHELASQAGVEIMKKGGNAIDAAAATALALHVVEPYNIGIGGGGFITVRFAKTGEVVFLDFREVAPASARKDMFASEQAQKESWSTLGGKASGVPGFVAGWFYALEKYGTMSFEQVVQPALRLAEEGYIWSAAQDRTLMDGKQFEELTVWNGDGAHIPYFKDGLPFPVGERIKFPGLGKAFRLLAKDGPKAFYHGPIGESLVKTINKAGGAMTMKDLADYKITVRKPVEGTYRGYKIYSSAPPSSGGTHVIQLLNFMENFDLAKMPQRDPETVHLWGQAMRMVFADRDAFMADTAFAKVPIVGLTSKAYAKTMLKNLNKNHFPALGKPGDPWKFEKDAPKVAQLVGAGREHFSTTHFSTVDAEGNIVAVTNTINFWFGSKVIDPVYQIPLNNQMDDFSSDPKSVNAPEPGKIPLSSMSPTIMLDSKGRPFMTLGAAGGRMILTTVAQVISNVVDRNMSMSEAIEAPRIWTDMEGETILEATFGQKVIDALKKKGYDLNVGETYQGVCQGILFNQATGVMEGAADQRPGTGLPAGF